MANPNKASGTAWETAVVGYLNEGKLPAKRTGSADAASSDIHFAEDWTAEAKAEARIDLPGYLRQLAASVEHGGRTRAKSAVWVKNRRHSVKDAYVVMSAENYRGLAAYVDTLEGILELAIGPELLAKVAEGPGNA